MQKKILRNLDIKKGFFTGFYVKSILMILILECQKILQFRKVKFTKTLILDEIVKMTAFVTIRLPTLISRKLSMTTNFLKFRFVQLGHPEGRTQIPGYC